MEPVAGPSILEILERQLGTILSALAVLAVGALMILFAVKPLTQALLAAPPAQGGAGSAPEGGPAAIEGPGFEMRSAFGDDGSGMGSAMGGLGGEDNLLLNSSDGRDDFLDELRDRREHGVKQKLQRMVEFDEEHAARVLKQWIKQGAGA
jgi:flagellar M-ring protein FliF